MGAAGAGAAVAGLGIIGSVGEASAIRAQGRYQETMFSINAKFAQEKARDAIDRGRVEETSYRKRVRKLIGAQRASMAAQGIDIDSGSAAEIVRETATLGSEDALMIRNNAYREAMGYKSQANSLRQQGRMAGLAARQRSSNTLLGGGLKALQGGLSAYSTLNGVGADTGGGLGLDGSDFNSAAAGFGNSNLTPNSAGGSFVIGRSLA